MARMAGIGKMDRERLALVLRATKGTIAVADVSRALDCPPALAAKLLSRWGASGWMARVRRGLYVPVPVGARSPEAVLEDPWIVAARLYEPCYIGGFSAGEHWDLTEQVYRTILVFTARKFRSRKEEIAGTSFLLRTIPEGALFGLTAVWRGPIKVSVSDPSRTMLDLLMDPSLGGGIRPVRDMFQAYLGSPKKNLPLLLEYARKLGNGAVFKRLGFLLEDLAPGEKEALEECRQGLTKGYARLDPKRRGGRLVSRWRVWVPDSWAKGKRGD